MAKKDDVTSARVPGVGRLNLLNPVAWIQVFLGLLVILGLAPLAQEAAARLQGGVSRQVSAVSGGQDKNQGKTPSNNIMKAFGE